MLLNLFSVLVDGSSYGGDDGSASSRGSENRFPQGVLASFPWEGWWQEDPYMVSEPSAIRTLPHGTESAPRNGRLFGIKIRPAPPARP